MDGGEAGGREGRPFSAFRVPSFADDAREQGVEKASTAGRDG